AGRPRREAFRVGLRLTARSAVRDLHDALVDQAAALARHARETRAALAADHTYLQPAQPTTVGHLLLAYAYPALRDAPRARRSRALMPQKKSPYALAAIRTQAGQAAGDLAAAVATLHAGSARTDHFHLLNGTVPRALDEAVAIARLTASMLEGIELRPARFEEIARGSFVTAADVADVLALSGELDYRSAHKVVGRAVRDLTDA